MTGVRLTPDVWEAIKAGRAVVALESSVLAQGLPIPANRRAAELMQGAVRAAGAIPAITAVVAGEATIGVTESELERLLARDGVRKVAARDISSAMVQGEWGATTVAGTLALLQRSDVSVFATGGIGGVHRDAPFDESGDLWELARTPAVVVCAGAKSILDLPATLERLESLGVPVVGYRTTEFPAFFSASSGLPVPTTVQRAEEVAEILKMQRVLGRREAVVVVQPPPAAVALDRAVVDRAVRDALVLAAHDGVRGSAVTPFLLREVERATGGASQATNLALLEANAALAAEIALCLQSGSPSR